MSDARGIHHEAVGFAGLQVEELEQMLGACQDKAQEVTGVVHNAVGNAMTEPAANAVNAVAEISSRIGDAITLCEVGKAELNRYSGGF
jgi:hypothetical protein